MAPTFGKHNTSIKPIVNVRVLVHSFGPMLLFLACSCMVRVYVLHAFCCIDTFAISFMGG